MQHTLSQGASDTRRWHLFLHTAAGFCRRNVVFLIALAAAVATVGILLLFLLIGYANRFINVYWIRFIFSCLSVWTRFQNFGQGVFDVAALFYYLSVTAVFLFLTVRIYDRRRYR